MKRLEVFYRLSRPACDVRVFSEADYDRCVTLMAAEINEALKCNWRIRGTWINYTDDDMIDLRFYNGRDATRPMPGKVKKYITSQLGFDVSKVRRVMNISPAELLEIETRLNWRGATIMPIATDPEDGSVELRTLPLPAHAFSDVASHSKYRCH